MYWGGGGKGNKTNDPWPLSKNSLGNLQKVFQNCGFIRKFLLLFNFNKGTSRLWIYFTQITSTSCTQLLIFNLKKHWCNNLHKIIIILLISKTEPLNGVLSKDPESQMKSNSIVWVYWEIIFDYRHGGNKNSSKFYSTALYCIEREFNKSHAA